MKWTVSIGIIIFAIFLIFLLAISPISQFGLIALSMIIGVLCRLSVEHYWKKYS